MQCPIDAVDEHAVYQRVANNSRDGQFVEDIRVSVFGKTIPFCTVSSDLKDGDGLRR